MWWHCSALGSVLSNDIVMTITPGNLGEWNGPCFTLKFQRPILFIAQNSYSYMLDNGRDIIGHFSKHDQRQPGLNFQMRHLWGVYSTLFPKIIKWSRPGTPTRCWFSSATPSRTRTCTVAKEEFPQGVVFLCNTFWYEDMYSGEGKFIFNLRWTKNLKDLFALFTQTRCIFVYRMMPLAPTLIQQCPNNNPHHGKLLVEKVWSVSLLWIIN